MSQNVERKILEFSPPKNLNSMKQHREEEVRDRLHAHTHTQSRDRIINFFLSIFFSEFLSLTDTTQTHIFQLNWIKCFKIILTSKKGFKKCFFFYVKFLRHFIVWKQRRTIATGTAEWDTVEARAALPYRGHTQRPLLSVADNFFSTFNCQIIWYFIALDR